MNVMTLDIETTGLDYMHDDIIEVAIHGDIGTADIYIQSDVDSAPEALERHHLTKDFLADHKKYDTRKSALEVVASIISDPESHIVAHNARFVFTMLMCNMIREDVGSDLLDAMSNVVPLDTMVMDAMLNPNARGRSRSLPSLCKLYGTNIRPNGSAKRDAKCIAEIADAQIGLLVRDNENVSDAHIDSLSGLVAKRAEEQQFDRNLWLETHGRDEEPTGYPYLWRYIEELSLDF